MVEFLLRQLQHEVGWKSVPVAFHSPNKNTWFDCIEIGKVCAQHHTSRTDIVCVIASTDK
jgi:hypothetical protein